jgi:hypothetical protein
MNTTLFSCALLVAGTGVSAVATAQTPSDSGVRRPAVQDSATRGYSDSAARVATDTAAPAGVDTATAGPAGQPSDSSLALACLSQGAAGDGSRVLMVSFVTDATAADRSHAAASIGGQLVGQAPTGENYVVVPDSVTIRDAADRLIQSPGVTQVTERRCQ